MPTVGRVLGAVLGPKGRMPAPVPPNVDIGSAIDPAANLARVRIVPAISKYAGGGAHVEFVFAAGELTLGTWQQIILLDFDNRARRRTW